MNAPLHSSYTNELSPGFPRSLGTVPFTEQHLTDSVEG